VLLRIGESSYQSENSLAADAYGRALLHLITGD
jgi:hypothetical protein